MYITSPALTDRANLCRTSGAPDVLLIARTSARCCSDEISAIVLTLSEDPKTGKKTTHGLRNIEHARFSSTVGAAEVSPVRKGRENGEVNNPTSTVGATPSPQSRLARPPFRRHCLAFTKPPILNGVAQLAHRGRGRWGICEVNVSSLMDPSKIVGRFGITPGTHLPFGFKDAFFYDQIQFAGGGMHIFTYQFTDDVGGYFGGLLQSAIQSA